MCAGQPAALNHTTTFKGENWNLFFMLMAEAIKHSHPDFQLLLAYYLGVEEMYALTLALLTLHAWVANCICNPSLIRTC